MFLQDLVALLTQHHRTENAPQCAFKSDIIVFKKLSQLDLDKRYVHRPEKLLGHNS